MVYTLRVYLVLIVLFGLNVSADERTFRLDTGRTSIAEIHAVGKTAPWLVYLPGSSAGLFHLSDSPWIRHVLQEQPFNVLIINKSGVRRDHVDFQEFNEGSIRQNRIADIFQVMKRALSAKSRIVLVGESEGAYIAPEIALADTRVEKLILLSGGTRSWIDEEVMVSPPKERYETLAFLGREVLGSSALDHFFRGWTYAQLSSYGNGNTMKALEQLKIPVFAAHGSEDKAIWLQAALDDWARLKAMAPNFESHLIKGQGHGVHCEEEHCSEQGTPLCELILKFTSR